MGHVPMGGGDPDLAQGLRVLRRILRSQQRVLRDAERSLARLDVLAVEWVMMASVPSLLLRSWFCRMFPTWLPRLRPLLQRTTVGNMVGTPRLWTGVANITSNPAPGWPARCDGGGVLREAV
jgi:hypothetical protein